MANQKLQGRKESLILRELTLIFERVLNNQILKNLSISEVKLSNDNEHAKVYYNFLPLNNDINKESVSEELDLNNKKIRSLLASKWTSRSVPDLTFVYDTSLENANRIDNILKEIKNK